MPVGTINTWTINGYTTGGASTINLVSVVATDLTITVNFSAAPVLFGPALLANSWTVSGTYPVTITGLSIVGNNIVFSTTPMTNGNTYTLNFPQVVSTASGGAYVGSSAVTFAGFGVGPTVTATVINSQLILVTYATLVNQGQARTVSNYTFPVGGLAATAVQQVDAQNYLVTTTRQIPMTSYSLLCAVQDVAGNLHAGGGSSASFTGAGFFVQDVVQITPTRVRVQFTNYVLAVSSGGLYDGLNPLHYTLTMGPTIVPIVSCQAVPNDPQSIDLLVATNLPATLGNNYTVNVVNVTTPEGVPINFAPYWTLNGSTSSALTTLSNARTTPAFMLTAANGSSGVLVGPGTVRVEPSGIRQESASTNNIAYSQLIGASGTGWNVSGGSLSTNTPDVMAPDGTQTASKYVFAGGNTYFYQGGALTPGPSSMWLRTLTGTAQICLFGNAGSGFVVCNVTSTWQRFTMPVTYSYFIVGGYPAGGTPAVPACTVYCWGAQQENNNLGVPTSYFPTNTNVLAYSQVLTNAGSGGNWVNRNVTVTANAAVAPDGTMTATLMQMQAGSAQHDIYQGASVPVGWTMSVYVQAGSVSYLGLSGDAGCIGIVNVSTGVVSYSNNATVTATQVGTTSWYRVSVTNTGGTNNFIIFTCGSTSALVQSDIGGGSTALGTENVYLWGAQLEMGLYPSSYMYTALPTTTRAADVQTITNPLASINPVNWSFGATLTPLDTWANIATAASSTAWFLQAGNPSLANGYVFNVTSGTNINANMWDAYANPTILGSPVSGSTPVVYSYFNNAGSQSDIPSGGLTTSTGTGIISTQGPTLTFSDGNNVYNFQGWLNNIWMNYSPPTYGSNLLLNPNGPFTSGAWYAVSATEVTGQVDPFGGTTASLFTDNAVNSGHGFYQNFTFVQGGMYQLTAYFKPGTYTGGATIAYSYGANTQGVGVTNLGVIGAQIGQLSNVSATTFGGFIKVQFTGIFYSGSNTVSLYFNSNIGAPAYVGTGQTQYFSNVTLQRVS